MIDVDAALDGLTGDEILAALVQSPELLGAFLAHPGAAELDPGVVAIFHRIYQTQQHYRRVVLTFLALAGIPVYTGDI